jgi:hypothetical protein
MCAARASVCVPHSRLPPAFFCFVFEQTRTFLSQFADLRCVLVFRSDDAYPNCTESGHHAGADDEGSRLTGHHGLATQICGRGTVVTPLGLQVSSVACGQGGCGRDCGKILGEAIR